MFRPCTAVFCALWACLAIASVAAAERKTEKIPLKHLDPADVVALFGYPHDNSAAEPEAEAASRARPSSMRCTPPPRFRLSAPTGIEVMIPWRADNSLLVRGTPEAVAELRVVLRALDVPAPQVRVTADVWRVAAGALADALPKDRPADQGTVTLTGDAVAEAVRLLGNLRAHGTARRLLSPALSTVSGMRATIESGALARAPEEPATIRLTVLPVVQDPSVEVEVDVFEGWRDGARILGRAAAASFSVLPGAADGPSAVVWLAGTAELAEEMVVVLKIERLTQPAVAAQSDHPAR